MIAAVIPTRFCPPQLERLLELLAADGVAQIVLDDDSTEIYAKWDRGVEMARAAGATEIAILNDDIEILPGTLPLLAETLRADHGLGVVYPDINAPWTLPASVTTQRTKGTWGAGGMTGFAFLFRAEIEIPFEAGYHWWYGDDAWEEAVRATGWAVGRACGVPIRHTPNGSASRVWPLLAPLIEADRKRWDEAHQ